MLLWAPISQINQISRHSCLVQLSMAGWYSVNWKRKKPALLWYVLIWQLTGGSASDRVSSDILWRKSLWSGNWKNIEVCHMWSVSHLMTSVIWRASHVTSLDTGCWRTWPDKERCDIWSDKTCDRANATSCSGGRALNWGLMERGLMKRNVTWLAMSLEDSADRSKISTPHSTLERRSQIWWRATLNYLVDEDHLRRWSNQMAASE